MPPVDRNNPKRAASSDSKWSLMEFQRSFPDDATCLDWLWRTRYSEDGTHAECPKCEQVRSFKKYEIKNRGTSWTCTGCGQHVHPTAGTIFHKSSTSLHLWFYAMYLMTSTRCGISAKQLERELGVTYKTAWRMFNLIRNELMTQDDDEPLSGEVEADEMWWGGRPRLKDKRQPGYSGASFRERKATVFGAVERGGRVRATVGQHRTDAWTHVERHVLPASTVYTDEYRPYYSLRGHYDHKRISHSEAVYVSGDVHTQTIEGFWSLVKNGLRGVYHSVSAKWLQGYLNEYAWRYNHRDDGEAQFLSLLLRAAAPS
jgi:transposase